MLNSAIKKKMEKLLTCNPLRHLPGTKFHRKFMQRHARTIGFEEAIIHSKGMTCIDLGANVGKYTRKMAKNAKYVIAFEPDPWALEKLRDNVSNLNNVRVENVAVGTREEDVLLYRHTQFDNDPLLYSESSSVIASKSNVGLKGAIKVRQVDFIKYLDILDEDIGILKIDIEGAEVDLLEALLERPDILKRVNHVFIETHERKIPGHKTRVQALRKKSHRMRKPKFNFYWN